MRRPRGQHNSVQGSYIYIIYLFKVHVIWFKNITSLFSADKGMAIIEKNKVEEAQVTFNSNMNQSMTTENIDIIRDNVRI